MKSYIVKSTVLPPVRVNRPTANNIEIAYCLIAEAFPVIALFAIGLLLIICAAERM